MKEEMTAVSRLVKLAIGIRKLGLWLLGMGSYLGVFLVVGLVLWKLALSGRISTGEAIYAAMFATMVVESVLFIFCL